MAKRNQRPPAAAWRLDVEIYPTPALQKNRVIECALKCCLLSLSICGALQAAQPKVECSDFQTRMIYHSPETPGYTSWVGLGKTPDGKLLVSFSQQTGKPPAVKGESIVLESSDVGKTWTPVKPDGYVGFQRMCIILPDGTIVKGVGPSGGDTGYILRSSDRGRTWGKRIDFVDPKRFKAWLGVIKPLLDGRLVLFAGVLERDPANPDANNNARMAKNMFVSADGGKSWSKPIQLMKIEEGVCEESDFCELPNGDLFWIHRSEHFPDHLTEMSPLAAKMGPNPPESYWYSDRMQSIVRREGKAFTPRSCDLATMAFGRHERQSSSSRPSDKTSIQRNSAFNWVRFLKDVENEDSHSCEFRLSNFRTPVYDAAC